MKFLGKVNVFFVFVLFVGTCLLSTNIVGLNANPKSTDINQFNKVVGAQETEYWALIVGVGIYADYPEQNRPLMLLEVDDFYNELLKSDVWSEDHIKVIKAEDATISNIISGLRWLDKMEDENDFSVVYFTTHGNSLTFDIPPFDEADKTDEVLASYWAFAYPTQLIWDDELNVLLNRLESKGVCLIVDSCYAGGFNDPPDWNRSSRNLFSFFKKQNTISSQEWMEGFAEDVKGQNRVVVMASCEDEVSYSGGFAPYFIDGLRGYGDTNSDGIVSAEEAFYYTLPRAYRQTPTIYDGYPGEFPLVYLNKTLENNENNNMVLNKKNIVSETYLGNGLENSVIKGFVKDAGTNDTIEDASVYLSGRDEQWEFFENQTTTDNNGFYSINVPPSRSRITISADGYCSVRSGPIEVEENETRWVNFSLYTRPTEHSIVCGYIKDKNTGDPINGADISLLWEGPSNQFYINDTKSDYLGFYQMNVAVGEIALGVEANGYFQEYIYEIDVFDYETLWFNFSLFPHPLENSVLCGYLTDQDTGEPINYARVTIQWVDIGLGTSYENETHTDVTGFYSLNVAPGELYVDIHEMGYDYYDPYRHDVLEYATNWLNITLDKQIIEVNFLKPLRALYINNSRVIPFNKVRIIGKIDIEAYTFGDWYGPGPSQIEKIEFYIDGKIKATDYSEPFVWTWDEKTIGKHTIKIVAYDFEGNSDSKELVVYKFL